jgi:hypothetical protein
MSDTATLIINTASGADDALLKGNPYRKEAYAKRAELLATRILPSVLEDDGWDEVIVAGIIPISLVEQFPNISFLHLPPVRNDRWDALAHREMAARHACGDLLVFCHDDHLPISGKGLKDHDPYYDILVPRRAHGMTGVTMNNGRAEGYMGGHCYVQRRWSWARLPLTSAPDEYWDTVLTEAWKQMGASIVWTNKLVHYDLEATAGES